MTIDSSITYDKDGNATSFNGPAAVDLYRIQTLRSALSLLSKGITPTRGLTMTKALGMATEYTGTKYKRTQAHIARDDLQLLYTQRLAAVTKVTQP
jgi:hypothetical protein